MREEISNGSGWVWDEDGHIVTNEHVIRGAKSIEVQLETGDIRRATVQGADPATVIENLPVGFRIMQFAARDRDRGENAKFTYRLDDPSGAFGLEGEGNLILARPELFDREKMEKVVVKVLAIEETPTVLADKVSLTLNTRNYRDIPC